jgi:hypothetical protein
VDKIDARLDGDIFEQIIRPGRNRRSDGQRGRRRGRRGSSGSTRVSFDRDGRQRQGQADGDDGADFAEETFVHKKMPDAGSKRWHAPGRCAAKNSTIACPESGGIIL